MHKKFVLQVVGLDLIALRMDGLTTSSKWKRFSLLNVSCTALKTIPNMLITGSFNTKTWTIPLSGEKISKRLPHTLNSMGISRAKSSTERPGNIGETSHWRRLFSRDVRSPWNVGQITEKGAFVPRTERILGNMECLFVLLLSTALGEETVQIRLRWGD